MPIIRFFKVRTMFNIPGSIEVGRGRIEMRRKEERKLRAPETLCTRSLLTML